MRELVGAVLDRLELYLTSLPGQSLSLTDGADDVVAELRGPLPAKGRATNELLDLVVDRAVPPSFNPASPGYLAFVPGGGILHAAAADLLAAALNRFVGVRVAAPALVEIEAQALRWLGELVGFPSSARGTFTSGGSLASWIALVTARRARLGETEAVLRATLYASDQVHHAVLRAAVLAGFPAQNVRRIAADDQFRLQPDAVASAIAADRAAGLSPFLLVGSAGTTNTGAVDPLGALADLAVDEGLWFHVDAAYGGFFQLTARGRRAMTGIDRADSLVLDPHKGLFLPYGTGAVLVRYGEVLRSAHHVEADYLPPGNQDPELYDPHELSPELSRPFRGLAVWFALASCGSETFAAALDEKLDLAAFAAAEVDRHAELERLAEPELSVVVFAPKHDPDEPSLEVANQRTRALLAAINAPQRVFLTGTTLKGRFVIRVCVLSFRTHADRMAMFAEDLAAAVDEVLAVQSAAAVES